MSNLEVIVARAGRAQKIVPFSSIELSRVVVIKEQTRQTDCDPWNFYKDGETWHIGGAHFSEVKGFYYIRHLIERPGQEVDCTELLMTTDPEIADCPMQSDCGETVDHKAIQGYKERLRRIAEEREEAERNSDLSKIKMLNDEMLNDEMVEIEVYLHKALGPGGKPRLMGDERKNLQDRVQKAIKGAINSIEREEPAVASHLRSFVKTGFDCRYDPSEATKPWLLRS